MKRGLLRHGAALLSCGAVLLFLLRIFMVIWMPLVPDEAYYWLWSRHLQWGYVDHPFMVAGWIRLGTFLWGDTAFGVRFAGIIGFGLANLMLFLAARRFFPGRGRAGMRAILLLNATLMGEVGLLPATPDTPLFVFLVMAFWALSHVVGNDADAGQESRGGGAQIGWWMLCGVSLGLAVDSKYTAILWGAGLAGFVLFSKRQYWRQCGPWLGGGAALVVTSPVLFWNAQHHWVGLLKQGGRVSQWHPGRAGAFLGELLAGQLALLTPWVAVLCLPGLWRSRRRSSLLLWLCLPAASVFLLHVTGERIQPNWVWVMYPALILAGAGYVRKVGGAVLSGQIMVFLVVLEGLTGVIPLPAHFNPVLRLSAGWGRLAGDLACEARKAGVDAIVTDDYALASILAFQKGINIPLLGRDSRWGYLQGLRHRSARAALLVEDAHYGPVGPKDGHLQRYGGGRVIRVYRVEQAGSLCGWEIR